MNSEDFFKIGYTLRTHGLKGGLTIILESDCADWSKSIFAKINNQFIPYSISQISHKGIQAIIKLEEVTSLEQAQILKGCSLYTLKSQYPQLAQEKFCDEEMIGFSVMDNNGYLGQVKAISQNGLARHIVVIENKKEIMIPMNGPFVTNIDVSKKSITVQLPDGLIDI